ncbi:sensor domain-containing diguanylate cyclase [Mesorhizobium sp. L-8-3]|uniref:sensor domain-containing diguanylate cyclase n=1 Tax=Mesorhizobium sp. L-8-3 TaxID=2744522 RepID=UPI001925FE53|nr:sensor domain-containing diguanylate cyclase [Mesorhizobium sp. L-8-3]
MGDPAGQSDFGAHRPISDRGHPPESTLYSLLARLRLALTSPFNARTVWRLHRQIEYQSGLLRQAEAAIAGAEIFERASVAARMGFWQCELPSERLTWSDGTYDLFGLQRRSGIVRSEILKGYSEESLARLGRVRGNAIEAGSGFGLDAEIRIPEVGTRWIRVSATVERRNGEPIRLFGIKQDITEEKKQLERIEYLAGHDVMTGLANRAQFEARIAEICESGGTGGVLMLIDLDGFKKVNDTLGHAIGDECLIEIARRLSAVCQSAELVARIGGDEFAVLFGPGASLQKVEGIARRIVRVAEEPMKCSGRVFRVGASLGYAFAEQETPTAVFTRADRALYAAKAAGRRTFSGPQRAPDRCLP